MWIYEEFISKVLDQNSILDWYAFIFSENDYEIYKKMKKNLVYLKNFEEISVSIKKRL